MQKLEDVLLEAEEFFKKCNTEYPRALSTYEQISTSVDTALKQNDSTLLLSQLPRLESDEGYLAFQYLGEARYLFRILNIISLESKYALSSFAEYAESKAELIEKYRLSLFCLRRFSFALSQESITEAESYLQQNRLSPFAIYILAKEELIIPSNLLFQTIQEIYQDIWTPSEKQLFKQLTATL